MANGQQPKVLLVDDEEMVLTSVRAFLSLETDYEVEAFSNPIQASDFLKSSPVDVVVSDYMMPHMNGLELLRAAKEHHPEAGRILLTGHADKQSAIQAINEEGLYQYLEKPWDNAQLLLVINGAIERARLLRNLEEKIAALDSANGQIKDAQRRLIRAFL
ncbi:MAG: response regulator [Paludibaculum sp.]